MNSTEHIQRQANLMNHFVKWPLLCGYLCLAMMLHPAFAADSLYENDAIVTYPGTESYPPVIDATNFVNAGTFVINFTTFSSAQPFYETSDTLNYTNTGTMMANTGFRFDNQLSGSGARTMSDNFFNSGLVSCGSTNSTLYFSIGGLYYYSLSYAQCFVNATNIVNPGNINVGVDGLIQLTGKNVDLTHSALNMEGISANVGTYGTGGFGVDTNHDWNPGTDLGVPYTTSSLPYVIALTNATAYIAQNTLGNGTIVTHAVFIQDDSGPNVTNDVQFIPTGTGYAVVEWVGSYLDAATGQVNTNYLYLINDYGLGASTNVTLINGYPDNFYFIGSPTKLIFSTPTTPGFFPIFPDGSITNPYSYADVQLLSATVNTNQIPNHSITNLPGRIEISAENDLNLANAHITGANYVKLQSPNQFEGSPQVVQVPYADVNLGVTNGFMTISNLMSPGTPNWSGNVRAWSTRWVDVSSGATNDYRVLIVGSDLNPQTLTQVQDLFLHATNSLVLSDALNVMRTFTSDTRNLTLTTNGPGNGATSLDGELNAESSQIFWGTSLPNLRNLTNNGAIRFQNLAQFVGVSNVVAVTPAVPAAAATGTLSETNIAKNVSAGDKVLIGTNLYVFSSKLTNTVPNQVLIAAKFDGSMSNLIAAINSASGAGSVYSTNTVTNLQVTAGALTNHAFTVAATDPGTNGNSIYTAVSVSATNLVWDSDYLSGGIEYVPAVTNILSSVSTPYENFINHGLLSDQGSIVSADNFLSSGVISNGVGSFSLQSLTTTLTNGFLVAGGDVSITADSLVTSNLMLQAGRSLTLQVTNLLTDEVTNGTSGLTNGNIWSVQSASGAGGNGLIMPIKPLVGDLLGTTISNYAAGPNMRIINIWAGQDRGVSASGYTNNVAVGQLLLDAVGSGSQFKFSGAGTSNALYVDKLVFLDQATNGVNNNYDFSPYLLINTNMMIYFAQATVNGISVAKHIDDASRLNGRNNGGRLRWVPDYAGYFSSANVVYPDGTTNTVNAALAQDSQIDSDGDGIGNAYDSTPFFVSSEINFTETLTNLPLPSVMLQWNSIPGSTNYVQYTTNLTEAWLTLTNYISPATVPPAGGWPLKNSMTIEATNTSMPHFYRVRIDPDSALLYGN